MLYSVHYSFVFQIVAPHISTSLTQTKIAIESCWLIAAHLKWTRVSAFRSFVQWFVRTFAHLLIQYHHAEFVDDVVVIFLCFSFCTVALTLSKMRIFLHAKCLVLICLIVVILFSVILLARYLRQFKMNAIGGICISSTENFRLGFHAHTPLIVPKDKTWTLTQTHSLAYSLSPTFFSWYSKFTHLWIYL